jgi:hypothetical protein
VLPHLVIGNRSLETCIFLDRWKLSVVTPIFKSGRRNDISNHRGIAILSAIAKLFELLVYRVMYEDLRDRLADCQHGFVKGRSTVSNLNEISSFVLQSIEDGCQLDSIHTDFSKTFDRVRCRLLLDKMFGDIEPVRCQWWRSYFSGRIQHIRMGNCVSRNILVVRPKVVYV